MSFPAAYWIVGAEPHQAFFSYRVERMRGMRILCLLIFALSFFIHVSANKHEKKLRSAMVVGTVYCDACFHQEFSKTSHFISGASVAVECGEAGLKPAFRKEVKTNEHGEFKVHLPFSVGKHVKMIRRCLVKLVSSSEPSCAVASIATSSSIRLLKSRKKGIHVFSAGLFTFKPMKLPEFCYLEPSSTPMSKFSSLEDERTSRPEFFSFFPPIIPSPPPFGIPLPPNPLQPPPLLPPLPFVPPPPPFINIPPLPFLTPPPPPPLLPPLPPLPTLPPLPPLPVFTHPPPPPPPPPPFLPFPPLPPIFPGIPPASPSKKAFP